MPDPITGGILNIPIRLPNPMTGQMTTIGAATGSRGTGTAAGAATAGSKAALTSMGTAFAAMIVVEVVFWLLDKLTGGRLSGQAKHLNAEPADMKRSAADMK